MEENDIVAVKNRLSYLEHDIETMLPKLHNKILSIRHNSIKGFRGNNGISKLETKVFTYNSEHFTIFYKSHKSDFLFKVVYPVKTIKGTLYVCPTFNITNIDEHGVLETNIHFVCYSAHFFDRYNERLNKTLNRKTTISSYFTEILISDFAGKGTADSGCSYIHLKNGLGLGNVITSDITFFKTFIDNNILNDEQKEIKKVLSRDIKKRNLTHWKVN